MTGNSFRSMRNAVPMGTPDRRPIGTRAVSARRKWHRSLITWSRPTLGMFVPFLTEDVARRVAASAVEDTGDLMRVFCLTTERPDGSTDTFWCYQPNYEIEEARGE